MTEPLELWRLQRDAQIVRCVAAELRGRSWELQVWKDWVLIETVRVAHEGHVQDAAAAIAARWETDGWTRLE